ncbi:MAG TPA: carboxymuconolactone decarboxylase family protein [Candidatus Lustribacter sp.]|jgi:alkylhydroperoxidase family enzyme|nr:carboxymuconolactone decarboxylase family protein [Candidatus Lustribacter sp.]
MSAHGRLPWFAPQDLDTDARSLYDSIVGGPRTQGPRAFPLTDEAGRLNGPFNAMLLSPEVGTALQELGAAIRYRSTLSNRAREIAILEVSVLRRCSFEWYAHVRVGEQAGLTPAEIAALRDGVHAPTLDATEELIRKLVRTLVQERDLDDATFATASKQLGDRVLMELIALVGYYELLALSLRIWRTPLPAGADSPF